MKKHSLRDPGHDQLKREGITDQSTRKTINSKIKEFFTREYNDIVESQLEANSGDDFQTDEILTKHMKVKLTTFLYSVNYIQ